MLPGRVYTGLEVEVEVEGLGVCVLEAVPLVVAWADA
jgi:hypothetical protein